MWPSSKKELVNTWENNAVFSVTQRNLSSFTIRAVVSIYFDIFLNLICDNLLSMCHGSPL